MAGPPARVNAQAGRGPLAQGRDGGAPARGQAGAHRAPARDIEWNGRGPGIALRHPGVRAGRRGPVPIRRAGMARLLPSAVVRSVAPPRVPAGSGATRAGTGVRSGPLVARRDRGRPTGPLDPCHNRVVMDSTDLDLVHHPGSMLWFRRPSSSDPMKNSLPAAARSRRPLPLGALRCACWSPRSAATRSNRSCCTPPRCGSRSSRSRAEP